MLNLSSQELNRLSKLNQDKATIEALKKLFLNAYIKSEQDSSENKAACYIAIQSLENVFKSLNNIQPEDKTIVENENMI